MRPALVMVALPVPILVAFLPSLSARATLADPVAVAVTLHWIEQRTRARRPRLRAVERLPLSTAASSTVRVPVGGSVAPAPPEEPPPPEPPPPDAPPAGSVPPQGRSRLSVWPRLTVT